MKLLRLTEIDLGEAADRLCCVLRRPGAVALVPTETVYGLVARAGDEEAVRRIYALKRRSASKALGWFIGDWRRLPEFGVMLDGWPERLAAEYCPGPLTIIAPRNDGTTQGFRVPDTPLLAAVLGKLDCPLVQTSANASGMPDAESCQEALAQLCGEVDCAVDGGRIVGPLLASTVVEAVGETIKILRKGPIDLQKWL